MWLSICAGVAIVAAIGWIISRGGVYRRLFADKHIMEAGQRIAALKQAALAKIIVTEDQKVRAPDDPRVLRTQAGLALVYTISRRATGDYVHHASVSLSGGYTAHAVGEMFILLWAKLLSIDYDRLALTVSQATVHHAEFVLQDAEMIDFMKRPVDSPDVKWLRTFRDEWLSVRRKLKWMGIDIRAS
jgi:hypothetical protein